MILIENEGALFRGPSRGVPLEVWQGGKWTPYKDAGKPKPIDWGREISEAEAKELMGDAPADGIAAQPAAKGAE